jgi:RNA polymerase sigma factor (sigma-70 family)
VNAPDKYYDDFQEDLSDPKCVGLIYDFSLRQVRGMVDYNDEDDVIQDVFYRLAKWPIAKKYNSKRHYFSLLRITVRQAIAGYWKRRHSQRNDVRKRRFISELQTDCQSHEFASRLDSPWYLLHLKDAAQMVLERAQSLNTKQRAMFELRFLEEKSHSEIAETLKISVRTSYRLESQLREIFQSLFRSAE